MDTFQKQFESLSIPYPKDTTTASLEQHKKEVVRFKSKLETLKLFVICVCILGTQEVQVAETIKESQKKVENLQKEVGGLLVSLCMMSLPL